MNALAFAMLLFTAVAAAGRGGLCLGASGVALSAGTHPTDRRAARGLFWKGQGLQLLALIFALGAGFVWGAAQ